MTPQLRFSKDFDSFAVEPNHLDVIYGGKAFRLAYPINEKRKFAVENLGNSKLLLPEMLLECYDRDISYGILVNVQAGFEDVLMLGRFVEKLSSVAGYQQVRVDEGNFSAMMSGGLEHEDDTGEEDFDEYDTDEEDVDESKEFGSKSEAKMNVQRPRPILMFVEERGNPPANPIDFHFPAGGTYFEITDPRDNVCYRFAHTQPVNNRTYESFPRDFGTSGGRRHKYLLHNVMMQSPPNPINTHRHFKQHQSGQLPLTVFVDLAEVDVFVDLGAFSDDVFRGGIRQSNYTPI